MSLIPSKSSIYTSLVMVFLLHSTMAVSYIKPDESRDLFKLEKIPLQMDGIKELARHLVVIARRKQEGSPINQRATGQLLALAIRLDPANQEARQTSRTLLQGSFPEASPEPRMSVSKARIRFYKLWLSSPGAGADANKLSNYLADATRVLHPDTIDKPDSANWKGVLPSLDKYTPPQKLPPPVAERAKNPGEEAQKVPPPKEALQFHITDLNMRTVFELQNTERNRTLRSQKISTIALHLKLREPEGKMRLKISSLAQRRSLGMPRNLGMPPVLIDPLFRNIRDRLDAFLKEKKSPLPGCQINVSISGGKYSRSNKLTLTAPVVLMLESSLKNRPLRNDIHLCAMVDKKGNITRPDNFWQFLEILRAAKSGGRLIVPTNTAELLAQVLVCGEPDFFTRWEVFSVSYLDEALNVAAKQSAADLAEASQLFESIKNLSRKTTVTKLAVNRAVRLRLAEIIKLAPNHLSARILLLQGSGKRPMRFSEVALAHNLLPIVQTMNKILNGNVSVDGLSELALKKIHGDARAKLDGMSGLVDRSNDKLYQDTLSLANDFRRLFTIVKRTERFKGAVIYGSSQSDRKKARTLFYSMGKDSEKLLPRILVTAGLPVPKKPTPKGN